MQLAEDQHSASGEVAHVYLSTACFHGDHDYCGCRTRPDGAEKEPAKCKFCDARCICGCHDGHPVPDTEESA